MSTRRIHVHLTRVLRPHPCHVLSFVSLSTIIGASPPPLPAAESTVDSLLALEGEGYGEGWAVPAADEESGVLRGEFENLWPLQLVDMRDEEMLDTLFRLLRKVPQVRMCGSK